MNYVTTIKHFTDTIAANKGKLQPTLKFYTKDGYCTEYAHACGYLNRTAIYGDSASELGIYVEMELLSGGSYEVRWSLPETGREWICFEPTGSIKEARKLFKALRKDVLKHYERLKNDTATV